jgi:hypothetical protein
MGNTCGCGGDNQPKNIDEYVKSKISFYLNYILNYFFVGYHLSKIKYEETNYELAK